LVEEHLPKLWDLVLTFVQAILLPAITFGLNELAASGSCITGWLSTVPMNIVQFLWNNFQVTGKEVFFAAVPSLVSSMVEWMFEQLYTLVVVPVKSAAREVDGFLHHFLTLVMSSIKTLESMIPKSIMRLFKRGVNSVFKKLIGFMGPAIKDQFIFNQELAHQIVKDHENAKKIAAAAIAASKMPPPSVFDPHALRIAIPAGPPAMMKAPTATPTAVPTPLAPTPAPTFPRDWGKAPSWWAEEPPVGPDDEPVPEVDTGGNYQPGDVEVPPPTAEDVALKNEAIKTDPVLRNTDRWLKEHGKKA